MAYCEKCWGSGREYQRQLADTGFEMRRRGSYDRPAVIMDWKTVDIGPCKSCGGNYHERERKYIEHERSVIMQQERAQLHRAAD
jgi:hypothetical protein